MDGYFNGKGIYEDDDNLQYSENWCESDFTDGCILYNDGDYLEDQFDEYMNIISGIFINSIGDIKIYCDKFNI